MSGEAAVSGVNEPLLLRVLRHIETHQDEWDQFNWVGLAGPKLVPRLCVAGWAYALGTGETLSNVGGLIIGNSKPIAETAARLLGFTDRQVRAVFYYARKANPKNPDMSLPITFADLCERVYKVTGVHYTPGQADGGA